MAAARCRLDSEMPLFGFRNQSRPTLSLAKDARRKSRPPDPKGRDKTPPLQEQVQERTHPTREGGVEPRLQRRLDTVHTGGREVDPLWVEFAWVAYPLRSLQRVGPLFLFFFALSDPSSFPVLQIASMFSNPFPVA